MGCNCQSSWQNNCNQNWGDDFRSISCQLTALVRRAEAAAEAAKQACVAAQAAAERACECACKHDNDRKSCC